MIQKNNLKCLLLAGLMVILLLTVNYVPRSSQIVNEVKKYALLVDQFAPNSVSPNTTTCNAIELKNSLLNIGWTDGYFFYLFGNEEITKTNLVAKINHLQKVVDKNDVMLVYFGSHGHGCLRDVLDINNWFRAEFLKIKTPYKVLLIDSCHAGEFIQPFEDDLSSNKFYVMGSVAPNEFAIGFTPDDQVEWIYSEPEFLGIISSHFWSLSLINDHADTNNDSIISMSELYIHSLPTIKKIYNEIFENDTSLASFILDQVGYLDDYPRPVVLSNLHENFSLYNSYLQEAIPKMAFLTTGEIVGIVVGSITSVIIVIVLQVLFLRRKKAIKI